MTGQKRRYRASTIHKRPCVKCGAPSAHQWRICATAEWHPVCVKCDVAINTKVAVWAFGKRGKEIAAAYKERVMG